MRYGEGLVDNHSHPTTKIQTLLKVCHADFLKSFLCSSQIHTPVLYTAALMGEGFDMRNNTVLSLYLCYSLLQQQREFPNVKFRLKRTARVIEVFGATKSLMHALLSQNADLLTRPRGF